MTDKTIQFTISDDHEKEMREILVSVYNSLVEKGYNPTSQLVGYILSEDPTYITTHNNARSLIRKIDRDELLQALLKAISMGTRLILVGDMDQLPSVGPGQVLRDLIASKAFPTVVLKKIFRQAEKSDIVVNAHKINAGQSIALDNKSRDFFFLERNDTNVIYKHMVQLITEKLPKYVDATQMDIQVLTPMRKGPLGVETLNTILQEYLNPPSKTKKEHAVGDSLFRVGDKVMQIRNNYQIEWEVVSRYGIPIDRGTGVFNGDVGRIKQINTKTRIVTVLFDDKRQVEYDYVAREELELAYAITVHKSQGSEYPVVIIPVSASCPYMLLTRNLIYTAITRAEITISKRRTIFLTTRTAAKHEHNSKIAGTGL